MSHTVSWSERAATIYVTPSAMRTASHSSSGQHLCGNISASASRNAKVRSVGIASDRRRLSHREPRGSSLDEIISVALSMQSGTQSAPACRTQVFSASSAGGFLPSAASLTRYAIGSSSFRRPGCPAISRHRARSDSGASARATLLTSLARLMPSSTRYSAMRGLAHSTSRLPCPMPRRSSRYSCWVRRSCGGLPNGSVKRKRLKITNVTATAGHVDIRIQLQRASVA